MEVKPGYKETDVGVLPEEWETVCLGEHTTKVGSGITPRGGVRSYKHEGRAFIRSQNVGWGKLILDDIAFIDDITHATFPNTEIHVNDVFLNITGASIGRSAVADIRVQGGNVNQHVCIIRTDNKRLIPRFLICFLLSEEGQQQIDSFQAGGNRQGLNFGQIRSLMMALPGTDEQYAISQANCDINELIQSLDRLISKKQNLKQAVMQQLLIGKTRLPGFEKPWEPKRLSDLLSYRRPDEYIVRDTKYTESGTPVLTANKSLLLGYTYETFGIMTDVPVIIFDDFTTDSKYVDYPFKVKSSAMKILSPASALVDLFFIHERMKLIDFQIGDHKRYYISEYQNISIPVPEYDEQLSIADALRDMCIEISTLELRRDKTIALKQGMMQALLTGRMRLI